MRTRRFPALALLAFLAFAGTAHAVTVTIDTSAARAVLDVINDPTLTHERAAQIATMPGNKGAIRKLREFKINATSEGFAHALYATAHGEPVTRPEEKAFFFDMVKPRVEKLKALVAGIDATPHAFQQAVQARIATFTPPGTQVALDGYVIAAGDGGGYAFGKTDFYLNLVMVDDPMVARSITTHELYHAIQGAYAHERGVPDDDSDENHPPQTVCANDAHLLANIYEEGSAVEVADVSLLDHVNSPVGNRMRDDLTDGVKHINTSTHLLEMSFASLGAQTPVPFDDVYGVGFFGHAILYNVAYVMAKAIDDADGPQGLAAFAKKPAYTFAQRYMALPLYGKDAMHPVLGPNTLAAVKRVAEGCH